MNHKNDDRKQRHYQKNRDRILEFQKLKRKLKTKKPAERGIIATFFARTAQCISRLSEPLFNKKLLLATLVLSCTAFLISESTRTLELMEGKGGLGKAVLVEFVFIATSALYVATFLGRLIKGVVLLGLITLTMLNTLGAPLTEYSAGSRGVSAKTEEVAVLTATIAKKTVLLNRYFEMDRLSVARRIESEITAMSTRLLDLKREMSGQRSEVILQLGLLIAILFRAVIMGAIFLFTNEFKADKKSPPPTTWRPRLALVHG